MTPAQSATGACSFGQHAVPEAAGPVWQPADRPRYPVDWSGARNLVMLLLGNNSFSGGPSESCLNGKLLEIEMPFESHAGCPALCLGGCAILLIEVIGQHMQWTMPKLCGIFSFRISSESATEILLLDVVCLICWTGNEMHCREHAEGLALNTALVCYVDAFQPAWQMWGAWCRRMGTSVSWKAY